MKKTAAQVELISELLHDAYDMRVNDVPGSIDLAERALHLSKEINCQVCSAKSYSHLSLFHMILGQYDESMRLAELAISIYSDVGDERGVADAMYNIAGIYYKTNNFHSGLIYLVDCLTIYKKFDDYHNQARVLKSLGTIHEYFGDTSSAVDSYQRAIENGKKAGDKNLQSNAYNPLSGIYLNRGQIDKAMDTILLSIEMKQETNDIRGLAFAIYGRGKVYAKMGKYAEAEKDFLEALEIHTQMREGLGRGMVLNKLGALYLEMKDYPRAKEKITEALNYSIESKTAFIKFKAYHHLYLIAKAEKNQAEALSYLEAFLNEKENVINAQTHKIIEAYQVISEKQNLELEARTQREKLDIIQKKNGELDAFFYKVSHDLKSPISSIIGLDALVREKITDKEALSYFDVYKKQVDRINNILDELMRMARVDHYAEKKETIDFNRLINECMSSLAYLANFQTIKFETCVAENLDYKAEWTLVNSIVQNLIENGIKYANLEQAPPKVILKVYQKGESLIIESEDNGIGMEKETSEKIFDMFFKADHDIPGSGLGLYILSRAVEKLNGTASVESQPGMGTTIMISLPLK
jgi:signal transduction histidine kinase